MKGLRSGEAVAPFRRDLLGSDEAADGEMEEYHLEKFGCRQGASD